MKNYRSALYAVAITLGCVCILSSYVSAKEEPGKWDAAGKEISEAAKAVGQASEETWQKTKVKTTEVVHEATEKGAETWDKTKKKSSEIVGKTKEVSSDVAEGTVEKSKGFWQTTKDTSKKWLEKAKAKIHEMTASDPN